MFQRWAGIFLKNSAELGLALGLVATCYFAILAVLTFTFPQGTSLQALVRERGSGSATLGSVRELYWASGGRRAEVATLSQKSHKVKDKSAVSIAWRDSREGMKLGERHSVQTFDRSWATISFDPDNRIELGENSLVVLRSFDREEDGSDRRASLLVLGGEVRGAFRPRAGGAALQLEMETAQGKTRIQSTSGEPAPTEFRVEVDEVRGTSRVSILRGRAEISAGGTTVPLSANETVQLGPSQATPVPVELPPAPRLRSAVKRVLPYRTQAPLISFEWTRVPSAEHYILVIARDLGFRDVIYRTECEKTEFEYGNLAAGRYHWQVSAVVGGLEGSPSAAARIVLQSDTTPPELSVAWPEETVRRPEVMIRGRSEAGVHVFVANEEAPIDGDGRFSRKVALQRGANVIVVEAVDRVGNTAYESHVVNAEY
jgi:hypothetical protein